VIECTCVCVRERDMVCVCARKKVFKRDCVRELKIVWRLCKRERERERERGM